jgi:PilZ domain
MSLTDHSDKQERRRFPRYYISARLTLAVEDESLSESIGLGEPGDISLGGLRVRNLPACPKVKVGDRLGLLLMDDADALSLHAEVIHRGSPDTFGVEFRGLSPSETRGVRGIIERLHPIVR